MYRRNDWLVSLGLTALLVGCSGGSQSKAPTPQEIQKKTEDMKSRMMEGGMMKGMDQSVPPQAMEQMKKSMSGPTPGQAGPGR